MLFSPLKNYNERLTEFLSDFILRHQFFCRVCTSNLIKLTHLKIKIHLPEKLISPITTVLGISTSLIKETPR